MESFDGAERQLAAQLGSELRRLREQRDLTQGALARRAGHYSRSTIATVETGWGKCSLKLIRGCDDALEAGGALVKLYLELKQAQARARDADAEELSQGHGSQLVGHRQPVQVLAVLPIRLSATESTQWALAMVEGFRDHLVARLSKMPGIVVVAPASSSDRGARRTRPPGSARFRLLSKLVQLEPARYSLSVQLTEALGHPVANAVRWAETFLLTDRELASALGTISLQVAAALKVALPEPDRQSGSDTGPDPESYEQFLRATGLLASNKEADLTSGLALLKGVVKTSPSFADGHALCGYASWRRYFAGWDEGTGALADARLHTNEALHLDEGCTWARMTLVRVLWDLGQHEQAVAEGIRAVADAPGHVEARLALARGLHNAGMADLALPLTEDVLVVDPSNLTAQKLHVWNLLMTRQLPDTVAVGTAYLSDHPGDSNTAWALAMAHALLGHPEAAEGVAEQGIRADHANFALWLLLGYVQLAAGDAERARRTWSRGARAVLDRLGPTSTNHRALAYVANMHAALGRQDEASAMAEGIEQADPYNGYLNYRLAHAFAELGDVERAVRLVEYAADCGFLSVQMLRCEEQVCALARLADEDRYRKAVRRLEDRVGQLRVQYGELLPAVIAPAQRLGGTGASSPRS